MIPRDEVAADPRARPLRRRAHRRDRARRRNHDVIAFLTNMAEHIGEPQQVGPLRHDVERPWRHGALLPDDAGARHRHRGRAPARRDLHAARDRVQGHALRGAHARHPRRADDVRHEVGGVGAGVQACRRPARRDARSSRAPWGAISGAVGSYSQHRPVRRAVRVREAGAAAGSGLAAGHRTRPARARARGARDGRRHRRVGRARRSARCRRPTPSRPRSRSRRARRAPARCRTSATRSPPSASAASRAW